MKTFEQVSQQMADLSESLLELFNDCEEKESIVALAYSVALKKVKIAHSDIKRAIEYQELLFGDSEEE